MKSILVVLVPVFAIAAACGGSVVDNNGNGGGSDGGVASDGGSTGNDGGLESVGCPPIEPTSGNCSPTGIQCEYGSDNGQCGNPYVDCQSGQWVQDIVPGPACLPSTGCPTDESQVQVGTACGDQDLECNFSAGRCTCSEQQGGAIQVNPDGGQLPREWRCEQPSSGCSAVRPRLGSACSQDQQTCTYGDCSMPDSIAIECTGGVWVNTPYACAG